MSKRVHLIESVEKEYYKMSCGRKAYLIDDLFTLDFVGIERPKKVTCKRCKAALKKQGLKED